jgi:hypothetical protein
MHNHFTIVILNLSLFLVSLPAFPYSKDARGIIMPKFPNVADFLPQSHYFPFLLHVTHTRLHDVKEVRVEWMTAA